MNVWKGLPWRPGGGRDCRPTLATIRGCVAMVASAFEAAPRTDTVSLESFSQALNFLQNDSQGLRLAFPGKNKILKRW